MRTPNQHDTIAELESDSRVHGHCPHCREELTLNRALLFYADDPLPDAARARLELRRGGLQLRAAELEKRRQRAEGAMQKVIDVTLGKILERVAPMREGFGYVPRDCRPLFDPIDYIVFEGLSGQGEVKSLSFIDVKTGGGALTERQRKIRAAIDAGNVEWREYSIEVEP